MIKQYRLQMLKEGEVGTTDTFFIDDDGHFNESYGTQDIPLSKEDVGIYFKVVEDITKVLVVERLGHDWNDRTFAAFYEQYRKDDGIKKLYESLELNKPTEITLVEDDGYRIQATKRILSGNLTKDIDDFIASVNWYDDITGCIYEIIE